MGNELSLDRCVSLENSSLYTEPTYTIQRTSGAIEDGWVISKPKVLGVSFPPWINQHATKHTPSKEWKVFMHNDSEDSNTFLCGWRSIEKIQPSSMMDDPETIRSWRYEFLKHLEVLEQLRLTSRTEIEETELAGQGFYESVAFVRNNQYNLFGYYSIVKTDLRYEFTLKKPAKTHSHWLNKIGEVTHVPLWQEIGEGDWVNVTADKILNLSTRNPLTTGS